jgi:hypothetical protein
LAFSTAMIVRGVGTTPRELSGYLNTVRNMMRLRGQDSSGVVQPVSPTDVRCDRSKTESSALLDEEASKRAEIIRGRRNGLDAMAHDWRRYLLSFFLSKLVAEEYSARLQLLVQHSTWMSERTALASERLRSAIPVAALASRRGRPRPSATEAARDGDKEPATAPGTQEDEGPKCLELNKMEEPTRPSPSSQ